MCIRFCKSCHNFCRLRKISLQIDDGRCRQINRGSYMSAHVLLNLLNELGKEIKCEACRAFYLFYATSLINSIKQEHEC